MILGRTERLATGLDDGVKIVQVRPGARTVVARLLVGIVGSVGASTAAAVGTAADADTGLFCDAGRVAAAVAAAAVAGARSHADARVARFGRGLFHLLARSHRAGRPLRYLRLTQ